MRRTLSVMWLVSMFGCGSEAMPQDRREALEEKAAVTDALRSDGKADGAQKTNICDRIQHMLDVCDGASVGWCALDEREYFEFLSYMSEKCPDGRLPTGTCTRRSGCFTPDPSGCTGDTCLARTSADSTLGGPSKAD